MTESKTKGAQEPNKELPLMYCAKLQDIIEQTFDEQGITLQNAFGNSYTHAESIALRSPAFRAAGTRMIDGTITWMFENKVTKFKRLQDEFIQRFFKWFAEVLKEIDQPGAGLASIPLEQWDRSPIPQVPV